MPQLLIPVSTIQYIVSGMCSNLGWNQDLMRLKLRKGLVEQGTAEDVASKFLEEAFRNDIYF